MLGLIRLFLGSLVTLFRSRAGMAAENLALRHQLGILLRSRPARLPLTSWDRALWAFVLHRFPAWRQSLVSTCQDVGQFPLRPYTERQLGYASFASVGGRRGKS